MNSPTLSYDPDANALYIRFSDGDVFETIELSDSVYVDVDVDGNPVGFEVLGANSSLLADMPVVPNTAELKDILRNRAA